MIIYVEDDHISMGSECAAEKLQIVEMKTQLVRYGYAHQFWGGDSLSIYPKSKGQYEDEEVKSE